MSNGADTHGILLLLRVFPSFEIIILITFHKDKKTNIVNFLFNQKVKNFLNLIHRKREFTSYPVKILKNPIAKPCFSKWELYLLLGAEEQQ